MSNRFIPNSFQVPNAVVDELIAELSGTELKIYLFVIRKTKGWNKESDAISISQFMEALNIRSNNTVISACKSLVERGLLVEKTGQRGVKIYSVNWCNNCTSAETAPVQKVHSTYAKTAQDPVQKLHTQKNNIKNTPYKNTIKKTTQKSSAFSPEEAELPDYVDREVWIRYCEMRKAKRSAIKTETTLKLVLRDLDNFSGGDPAKAIAILERSIANTWTGIFALKPNMASPTTVKSDAHSGFAQRKYEEHIPDFYREA